MLDNNSDHPDYFPKGLNTPLFKNQVFKYAITVNVASTKFMNRKQWHLYTNEQQRSQLTRIEAAFRRNNPSVKLIEIQYEVCPPPLKPNIHFHALYEMPRLFKYEMMTHYDRICSSTNAKTKDPWRHLDVQNIVAGEQQWLDYIRKDLKT